MNLSTFQIIGFCIVFIIGFMSLIKLLLHLSTYINEDNSIIILVITFIIGILLLLLG